MGKIIGIDLGTTNSCVALLDGKEPIVITNYESGKAIPNSKLISRMNAILGVKLPKPCKVDKKKHVKKRK